jgi:hypothetical protein
MFDGYISRWTRELMSSVRTAREPAREIQGSSLTIAGRHQCACLGRVQELFPESWGFDTRLLGLVQVQGGIDDGHGGGIGT